LECRIDGKKQFWNKSDIDWQTYADVGDSVKAAASGLLSLSAIKDRKESGTTCIGAILADTSAEWHMSAQAMYQLSMPITTVYTTLGQEAMLHGLNETEATVIFIDWQQYNELKEKVLAKVASLRHIVIIGKSFIPETTVGGITKAEAFPSPEEAEALPKIGEAASTTFDALVAAGRERPADVEPYAPGPDDLAFIMYTSGSTGLPKGVMLTHKNFVGLVASIFSQKVVNPLASDTFIAFLPLAHILELIVETCVVCAGGGIAYAHPRTLTPASPYMDKENGDNCDLLTVRPSLMVAVPAILETIKSGLMTKVKNMEGYTGMLVRGAIAMAQEQEFSEGCTVNCLLSLGISPLLLHKVRAQLGLDNLRAIVSGGAPLAAQTQEFVSAVLAPVAQGYGATETNGCTTVQEVVSSDGRPIDHSTGGVGAVQPCCEVKLKSVPDMGYLVTDSQPRGEILVSGCCVSQKGYFKMGEKSREDFPVHSDGKVWFHTGDIGEMTAIGTLRIIDRKKDLIKLTGGEYVSLGKVENAMKQVTGISQVVVFAKSDKDHCVAIVSQPERGWGTVGGKPEEAELAPAVDKALRKQGLARFEIPTKVKVTDEIWTPETGLVTASLKLQRNPLRNHYNEPGGLLEQMDYRFPAK